jgi:hypothetical protein
VGLGRAVGARCRAGRSRGKAGPGGRHALLGGAGPTTGTCCRAGLGRGRHEVAEGLGRLGIGEGRRGETGPVHATERGRAAGTWSRQGGWPACGERGAGVAGAWGAGSRGAGAWGAGSGAQKSGGSGEEQKNERDSQIGRLCSSAGPRNIKTHLMFLNFLTESRNISRYVHQRSDVRGT